MINNRITRILAVFNAVLVGIIAIIAFTISYSALKETAMLFGIVGWLSFLWPLLIDLSLVVFTLSYLVAHITGGDTRFPIAMIGLYTVATIGFNLVHSDSELIPHQWTAYIVAIVAPVSLFFTTESLAQQFKAYVMGSATVPLPAYQPPMITTIEIPHNEPAPDDAGGGDHLPHNEPVGESSANEGLNERIDKPVADQDDKERATNLEAANGVKGNRIEANIIETHRLTSQGLTIDDIAERLNKSSSTVSRYRRLAQEMGLNGVAK